MTPTQRADGLRLVFADHFDVPTLDPEVWVPHYLPAWSSRAATAATYDIHDSCLRLSIPHEQENWLPRSMVAWWMVGLEDPPDRCAEICVAEMFGDAVEPGRSTAVGMGLHSFRDPLIAEDFEAVRLPIDLAEFHTYAVDWAPARVDFFVDGELIRTCAHPPAYPDADDDRGFRLPGPIDRQRLRGDPRADRRLSARLRANPLM